MGSLTRICAWGVRPIPGIYLILFPRFAEKTVCMEPCLPTNRGRRDDRIVMLAIVAYDNEGVVWRYM